MDSNVSTPFAAFKSKKPMSSPTPADQKIGKVSALDSNPICLKTPSKKVDPPRRSQRRRTTVMSINEIRQAALKLRESGSQPAARPDPVFESEKEHVSRSKKSSNKEIIKLPEKYVLLEEFFNGLDSSIRLLSIKNYATTFSHISSQVRTLTGRSFLHSHLAQLKFIMPEVIVLKKILKLDERTCCMMPELIITLEMEAIKSVHKLESQNKNLQLRKVFRDRLLDFFKSHPEGDEVPEEALPEPFNRSKENEIFNLVRASASSSISESPNMVLPPGPIAVASRKRFSKLCNRSCVDNIQQEPAIISVPTVPRLAGNPFKRKTSSTAAKSPRIEKYPSSLLSTPVKSVDSVNDFSIDVKSKSAGNPFKRKTSPPATKSPRIEKYPLSLLSTPVKSVDPVNDVSIADKSKSAGSPSIKEVSPFAAAKSSIKLSLNSRTEKCPSSPLATPVKSANSNKDEDLLSTGILGTPISCTPKLTSFPTKRCYMTPDEKSSELPPSKLLKRPPPSRTLKFDTPVKKASVDDDIFDADLLESIREKERKAAMENDPAISLAKQRQQIIAGLPRFFDMVHYLFNSIRRSVVTKEELIHKIISGNAQIVDRKEVEENLRLLQELAPEWIHEKSGLSGDVILCVNNISSPGAIRTKLVESK